MGDESDDNPKVCAACGRKGNSLKMCTGCHLVHYCGRQCQMDHRKAHKKICKEQEKKRKNAQAKGIGEDELDKPVVSVLCRTLRKESNVAVAGKSKPRHVGQAVPKEGGPKSASMLTCCPLL